MVGEEHHGSRSHRSLPPPLHRRVAVRRPNDVASTVANRSLKRRGDCPSLSDHGSLLKARDARSGAQISPRVLLSKTARRLLFLFPSSQEPAVSRYHPVSTRYALKMVILHGRVLETLLAVKIEEGAARGGSRCGKVRQFLETVCRIANAAIGRRREIGLPSVDVIMIPRDVHDTLCIFMSPASEARTSLNDDDVRGNVRALTYRGASGLYRRGPKRPILNKAMRNVSAFYIYEGAT